MADPVKLYDEADKLKDEGKLEEAVAKLREALGGDQNYALAHSALAVVLQKLGQHEEAIQHARRRVRSSRMTRSALPHLA